MFLPFPFFSEGARRRLTVDHHVVFKEFVSHMGSAWAARVFGWGDGGRVWSSWRLSVYLIVVYHALASCIPALYFPFLFMLPLILSSGCLSSGARCLPFLLEGCFL